MKAYIMSIKGIIILLHSISQECYSNIQRNSRTNFEWFLGSKMFTLPNLLSFMRMPLALLFFQENPIYRALAIVLAMITDGLDGYLARKYQLKSKIGTWLDPLTDKLFVLTALGVLVHEQRLLLWQAGALMGRDFSVMGFGLYLALRRRLTEYQVRAIWWGKVTTALQFIILLVLVFHGAIPANYYIPFIGFALLAFRELYISRKLSVAP